MGGVRGVAADNVDDGFGGANSWSRSFPGKGHLEIFAVETAGEGFEFVSYGEKEVDSLGEGHEERAWSMVREHPLGRAPGSLPMRVKEPSSCRIAKSWVRMAETL